MKKTHPTYRLSSGHLLSSKIMFVLGAMAVFCLGNTAFAQSVQFEIGESSRLLEASIDMQRGDISQAEYNTIRMTETCKSPSSRLQNRNRPWMVVWNTSNTADEVDTVTIDLTEAGFEFGDGDVSGDGFGGLLSMLSDKSDAGVSLTSATHGADDTELVLDFDGLTPGVAAIFRIDIDEPGGLAMFPDFREAMMGADTGDGPGQLATMTTDFSLGGSTVSMFAQAGPLSTSGIAEAYHGQTMSMVETSTTIPEPTTLLLLAAGMTGIATMRRTR